MANTEDDRILTVLQDYLKVKVWQPHFMLITYDSNSTDKLKVDGALILPPCSISALFSKGILKLVKLINNR